MNIPIRPVSSLSRIEPGKTRLVVPEWEYTQVESGPSLVYQAELGNAVPFVLDLPITAPTGRPRYTYVIRYPAGDDLTSSMRLALWRATGIYTAAAYTGQEVPVGAYLEIWCLEAGEFAVDERSFNVLAFTYPGCDPCGTTTDEEESVSLTGDPYQPDLSITLTEVPAIPFDPACNPFCFTLCP